MAGATAHTLGIIGGGNMGGAIIRGAIDRGVLEPRRIIVGELDDARRAALAELGCTVTAEAREAAAAEQLMLAVKPQGFASVAEAVGELDKPMVVMSIMAGIDSATIRASLGGNARVIRIMPNTPCQIGFGMTAIALGEGAQSGDQALAVQLFGALGKVISVAESLMHAVTAVSGSGPAYVFLVAEAMEQAAMQLGLSHGDARTLVSQTIIGAARLMEQSHQTPGELRQAVTSPGGTTAAALEVMFERELPQIIAEALLAARDRGQELAVG